MSDDANVFVVAAIGFQGKWHCRCIDCGRSPVDGRTWWRWPTYPPLYMRDQLFEFYSPPGEDSIKVPRMVEHPIEIYETDPAITNAPSSARVLLMIAQNSVILLSEGDLSNVSLPGFACSQQKWPSESLAIVKFSTGVVNTFPEVSGYVRRCRADVTAQEPTMTYGLGEIASIPAGMYLPASVLTGLSMSAAAYSVEEWHSPLVARVRCHLADNSVPLAIGSRVVRPHLSSDSTTGVYTIGSVEEILE